jgi:transposase
MDQREIAERCGRGTRAVYTVSRQYVKEGIARVLNRKKRETPPASAKVTGEVEAKITALSRGAPPPGQQFYF